MLALVQMTMCACGCGNPTLPYTATDKRIGAVKGEFAKRIKGHNPKRRPAPLTDRKLCRPCGKEYPRTSEFFFTHIGHRDGLSTNCKDCASSTNQKWVKEHSEDYREYERLYRLNNPAKVKGKIAEWLAKHPGYAAETARRWREANDSAYRSSLVSYRAANKDTVRAASILYKHKKRAGSTQRITAAQLLSVFGQRLGRCGVCDSTISMPTVNWDHITPIARGGKHELSNLQPVHRQCNSMKGAKPLEWARDRVKALRDSGQWKERT